MSILKCGIDRNNRSFQNKSRSRLQNVQNWSFSNDDIEEKEKDFDNHDENWFDRHLISIALLLLVEIVASVAVLHRISIPELVLSQLHIHT